MTEFVLHRYEDVSGVTGEGDVAWGVEWPDGAVALRWPGEHPSTAVWPEIRDAEAIHGHGGKTVVMYKDSDQLVAWYERICKFLVAEWRRPITCGPHPDMPGRIRITYDHYSDFTFWIALLDGSTDVVVHDEVDGMPQRRWTSPDGLVWLVFNGEPESTNSPAWADNDDPLESFDREDR